jgi:TolB-like protein
MLDAGGPALIVLPFEALGLGGDDRVLAEGVSQQLISDLMRFSALRIYSPSASFREEAAADPRELGRRLGVSYVLTGSVSAAAPSVRVTTQLTDAGTGQVRWSRTFDRTLTPGDLLAVQGDIAAGIAAALGQPYGVVKNDVTARVLSGSAATMPSYACVLRAYAYRRSFATELYAPVRACLEAAVARDPGYSDAWALLGWLRLDAVRFGYADKAAVAATSAGALAAARRATELDPKRVLALQALAAVEYYAGDHEGSERDQRAALALNPNDPDTMAQLGWRLAARGNWDEGIPLLRQAIDRTIDPPGWYFHLVAVGQFLHGDFEGMLATAERAAVDGSALSQSFIAIAQGALGHREAAAEALARMAAVDPRLARDPAAVYREHQTIPSTVDALVGGLRKAGWSPPTN